MTNISQVRIKKNYYNPDGTMKPTHRDSVSSGDWTEDDINEIEQRRIGNAAIDQKVTDLPKEGERVSSLESPHNPLSTSNKLTHLTRAEQIAGLDAKELFRQGLLEPDDFYYPLDDEEEMDGLDAEELLSQDFLEPDNFYEPVNNEEMAGLDAEELLSQGFLEPDDFYEPLLDEVDEKQASVHVFVDLGGPDILF